MSAIRLVTEPGTVFGRLTVINYSFTRDDRKFCSCECSCGNLVTIAETNLLQGDTKSCGCLNRQLQSKRFHYMNAYLKSKNQFFNEEK